MRLDRFVQQMFVSNLSYAPYYINTMLLKHRDKNKYAKSFMYSASVYTVLQGRKCITLSPTWQAMPVQVCRPDYFVASSFSTRLLSCHAGPLIASSAERAIIVLRAILVGQQPLLFAILVLLCVRFQNLVVFGKALALDQNQCR